MDKKILNATEALKKANDSFYEDCDITYEEHKENEKRIMELEKDLLAVDKIYDRKRAEQREAYA